METSKAILGGGLSSRLNLAEGTIEGGSLTRRYLSELEGVFANAAAYRRELAQGNPLVYTVSSLEPAEGDGQLHFGLGVLMPGQVGGEYFLTKGHMHAWRPAAEVYLGLRGKGLMLLEDEEGSRVLPLGQEQVVYVTGYTAHRTINTGSEPLVYLGIYPAAAGHDYNIVRERNFRAVVIERDGEPVVLDRSEWNP